MHRNYLLVLVFISALSLCWTIDFFVTELNLPLVPLDYSINLPAHFLNNAPGSPLPTSINGLDNTPANNPITNAGATLGRVLFYDRNLSENRTISCASCHQAGNGFSDPSVLSTGFDGGNTRRHSMTLINARYYQRGRYFWDERAATLEDQVLMPFQDPVEMGLTLTSLVDRVNEQYYYPALFVDAFGSSAIDSDKISKALAQFVRSIVSYNSKYDVGRAQVNGPGMPFPNFTAEENLGKQLFFQPIPNGGACFGCHTTEAFVSANPGPQNNGIDIVSTTDFGAGETFPNNPNFQGRFKTTTLRNIELTAPYMHDGRFQTLEQVVDHYNTNIQPHPTLSPALKDANGNPVIFDFSGSQKAALVAFMRTLTDASVATAEKWSNPFMNNTNLIVTNQNDTGVGSLRSILSCAGSGDTIRFAMNIDTVFLNIPLRIFKNIALKDELGNPVVIKANFNNSGFTNATYGVNIAPSVEVFLQNIKLSHYNNSTTKPLLKNEGNLTLSSCELNGNIQSIFNNQGGSLKIQNVVTIR